MQSSRVTPRSGNLKDPVRSNTIRSVDSVPRTKLPIMELPSKLTTTQRADKTDANSMKHSKASHVPSYMAKTTSTHRKQIRADERSNPPRFRSIHTSNEASHRHNSTVRMANKCGSKPCSPLGTTSPRFPCTSVRKTKDFNNQPESPRRDSPSLRSIRTHESNLHEILISTLTPAYAFCPSMIHLKAVDVRGEILPINDRASLSFGRAESREITFLKGEAHEPIHFRAPGTYQIKTVFKKTTFTKQFTVFSPPDIRITTYPTVSVGSDAHVITETIDMKGRRIPCSGLLDVTLNDCKVPGIYLQNGVSEYKLQLPVVGPNVLLNAFHGPSNQVIIENKEIYQTIKLVIEAPHSTFVNSPTLINVAVVDEEDNVVTDIDGTIAINGECMNPTTNSINQGTTEITISFHEPGDKRVYIRHTEQSMYAELTIQVLKKNLITVCTPQDMYTLTEIPLDISILEESGKYADLSGPLDLSAPHIGNRILTVLDGKARENVIFDAPGSYDLITRFQSLISRTPIDVKQIPKLNITAPAKADVNTKVPVQVEAVDTLSRRIPCNGPLDVTVNGQTVPDVKLVDGRGEFRARVSVLGANTIDAAVGSATARAVISTNASLAPSEQNGHAASASGTRQKAAGKSSDAAAAPILRIIQQPHVYCYTPSIIKIHALKDPNKRVPLSGNIQLESEGLCNESLKLHDGKASTTITFDRQGSACLKASHPTITTETLVNVQPIPALKLTAPAKADVNTKVPVQVEAVDTLGRRIPCNGPLDVTVNGQTVPDVKLVKGNVKFDVCCTDPKCTKVITKLGQCCNEVLINSVGKSLVGTAPSTGVVGTPAEVSFVLANSDGSVNKKGKGVVELEHDALKTSKLDMKEGVVSGNVIFIREGTHTVTATHKDSGMHTTFTTIVQAKAKPWIGCEISDSAEVVSVVPGGPADRAGISVGEHIISVEMDSVSDIDDFRGILKRKAVVGQSLKFEIKGDSGIRDTSVLVGDKRDSGNTKS